MWCTAATKYHVAHDRRLTLAAWRNDKIGRLGMKVLKVLLISIGALLAALIVVPLTILAGLFVWLKLTEENDDDDMELDDAI